MLKPFLSERETNVAQAQGSRIPRVSGEAGTGTRQALTAAARAAETQQRVSHAQLVLHSISPRFPACFGHDQPVQLPGAAWFYL